MEKEKENNIWKIGFIISIVIIIIMLAYIIIISTSGKSKNNSTQSSKATSNSTSTNISNEERYTNIRIDEDLSSDGQIEGIENVRWNNARISEDANQMQVSIMINNESQTEKVASTPIEVSLLDENGKVIDSREVVLEEIEANYGYTNLELNFEIENFVVVHDIQIKAIKE